MTPPAAMPAAEREVIQPELVPQAPFDSTAWPLPPEVIDRALLELRTKLVSDLPATAAAAAQPTTEPTGEPEVRSDDPPRPGAQPAAVAEPPPKRRRKKAAERTIAPAAEGDAHVIAEQPNAEPAERKPLAVIEGGGRPADDELVTARGLVYRRAPPELAVAAVPKVVRVPKAAAVAAVRDSVPAPPPAPPPQRHRSEAERAAFWDRVRELVDELPDEPRTKRGHIWSDEPVGRTLRFTDHGEPLDREPSDPAARAPVTTVASATADERALLGLQPRAGRAAKVTIAMKRITKEELKIGMLLWPGRAPRPTTRGQCANVPRPCPFVACRHHLYLDVGRTGSITVHDNTTEVWDMAQSCSLDVAEIGGVTLETAGVLLQVTRERVRQIETKAIRNLLRRRDGRELAQWLIASVADRVSPRELALGS